VQPDVAELEFPPPGLIGQRWHAFTLTSIQQAVFCSTAGNRAPGRTGVNEAMLNARRPSNDRADNVIGGMLSQKRIFESGGRIHEGTRWLDARSHLCYKRNSMLNRIATSLVTAVALVATPFHASARTCIVTDSPIQKACQPGCCANKTCCATSPKNTAPVSQPLAKSGSDQQNVAVLPSQRALALLRPGAIASSFFSCEDSAAHSPPRLALTCIRLI